MIMNKILLGLLVVSVIAGGFFFKEMKVVKDSVATVDTTQYELMVCINNDDKPLFQGLVTDSFVGVGYVKFTEDTGLRRFIQGATCILTKGTQADFAKADAAMKEATASDTGASDPEGDDVPEG
jgi:hypothetical protein